MVLTVPETYAPTILLKRARRLRKETGDPSYVTEQEISRKPLSEELKIYFLRPFQLLFVELIVFLISIYMSVLYGLLYMFFVAYVHHLNPPVYSRTNDQTATRSSTKKAKVTARASLVSCSSQWPSVSSAAQPAPLSSTATTDLSGRSTAARLLQKHASYP